MLMYLMILLIGAHYLVKILSMQQRRTLLAYLWLKNQVHHCLFPIQHNYRPLVICIFTLTGDKKEEYKKKYIPTAQARLAAE